MKSWISIFTIIKSKKVQFLLKNVIDVIKNKFKGFHHRIHSSKRKLQQQLIKCLTNKQTKTKQNNSNYMENDYFSNFDLGD